MTLNDQIKKQQERFYEKFYLPEPPMGWKVKGNIRDMKSFLSSTIREVVKEVFKTLESEIDDYKYGINDTKTYAAMFVVKNKINQILNEKE